MRKKTIAIFILLLLGVPYVVNAYHKTREEQEQLNEWMRLCYP